MGSYKVQYYGAWVCVVVLAFTGAIQLAGPDDLGLSMTAYRWIGILASALGVLQGLLPSLRRPPVAHDDPSGSTRDPQPRDE